MKITVIAKAGKKENKIVKINDALYEVWTKMPAKENKANEDINRQLSEYFRVSKSRVNLLLGKTSKEKVFEIAD